MKIDREYQKHILSKLADTYPNHFGLGEWLKGIVEPDPEKYAANMLYLEEHGLLVSSITISPGGMVSYKTPKITAKGIDFLLDDGGLTAILGVVTVKLHSDTIKALIENKINKSNLKPVEKNRLIAALQRLPAYAIRHLTEKLVEAGIENLPALLQLIGKAPFFSQG